MRIRAADLLRDALPSRPLPPARAPRLQSVASAPLFGDAATGALILQGVWEHAGQRVEVGLQGHPFALSLPSERFADWVHGFGWLPDLLAVEGGAVKARELAAHWMDAFPGRPNNLFVNAPDRLAGRMFQWGRAFDALSDEGGRAAESYFAQMRRLSRDRARLGAGLPVLRAASASVMFGARTAERLDAWLARGLDQLDAQLAAQVLPDGGHVSRSPLATVRALETAVVTDAVLGARGLSASAALSRAIDRMAPMVRTLRHTDGAMAVFQGGGEGRAAHIEALLAATPGDAPAFAYGPHTGYHRLEAGGSVLLIDTAGVAPHPHDAGAHLAPLALELSTAEGRLIVNCGWHEASAERWRRPVRAAAAHSTLVLDERSPGEIAEGGLLHSAFGAAVLRGPGGMRARRKEQNSGIWLECAHDGYMESYGLKHRRKLFMGEDGDDIRGEDSLYVPAGDAPLRRDRVPFTLRFHFHPDVRVSLAQDLSSALLVQRGRAGWRFRTDAGPLAVEPSVYLGGSARPVRSQQLVIRGAAYADGDGQGRDNRVRWSLRRLRPRRGADATDTGAA